MAKGIEREKDEEGDDVTATKLGKTDHVDEDMQDEENVELSTHKEKKKKKKKMKESDEFESEANSDERLQKIESVSSKKRKDQRLKDEPIESITEPQISAPESNEDQSTVSKKKKKKRKHSPDREDLKNQNTDEGSTALENSTCENPRKKKKKEKQKTKKTEECDENEKQVGKGTATLEYLHQWKNDRKNWKFKTVRQVWILQNMYNSKQVSDSDFEVVLEYIDGMKGKSRDITVQEAEKLLSKCEKDSSNEGGEDQETKATDTCVGAAKYDRIRRVIQMLSQ